MAEDVTVAEVVDWAVGLDEVLARIRPRFARAEPRTRAGVYLRGLLSAAERKNGWTLAEQAGDATPDGMQRLLKHAGCHAAAAQPRRMGRRRGPRRPAQLRHRALGRPGRGAGDRRDRISEEGQ